MPLWGLALETWIRTGTSFVSVHVSIGNYSSGMERPIPHRFNRSMFPSIFFT